MDKQLEYKLAQLVNYLDNRASNAVSEDGKALMSYLDDADVAGWLQRMRHEGRVDSSRFINSKRF